MGDNKMMPPPGGPQGTQLNAAGVIRIAKDAVTYADDGVRAAYADCVSEQENAVIIENLSMESGDFGFTGISVNDDSHVILKHAVIDLGVAAPIEGHEDNGTAVYIDSGVLRIEDSDICVSGAARYTVAAEKRAKMQVIRSTITGGGDMGCGGNTSAVRMPPSNMGLLISGTSRANFSVDLTETLYEDSVCVAEGWAALSTDSATAENRDGLDFTAIRTEAIALHGGYGIYSDTDCRDYLDGVTFVVAEIGAIVSNNGLVHVKNSEIRAGRNAFMLHSPDMPGENAPEYTADVRISDTQLITDDQINRDGIDYTSKNNGRTYHVHSSCDYAKEYGEATGAYVEHIKGSAILIKSTSADVKLNHVSVQASNGVVLHTVINSDMMSRFLKEDGVYGVHAVMTDSELTGDIVHEDYQRDLFVEISGSNLSGAVTYCTADEWSEHWKQYAGQQGVFWLPDPETYIMNTHKTELSLTNRTVWNVTSESKLTRLSVSADSSVNGVISAESEEISADGTKVYRDVIVAPKKP